MSNLRIISGEIKTVNGDHVMWNLPEIVEINSGETELAFRLEEGECVTLAHELTLIRVFNYADKWHLATKNKLDAFKSWWSENTSFGEFFEREVDDDLPGFFSHLDPQFKYFFLIPLRGSNRVLLKRNPAGRHVILAAFERKDGSIAMLDDDEEMKANAPQTWTYFEKVRTPPLEVKNMADLLKFIHNEYQPKHARLPVVGFTVMRKDGALRALFPQYAAARQLRDNIADIELRYLQLMCEHSEKAKQLLHQHPCLEATIDRFYNLVNILHNIYMDRYIKKCRVHTHYIVHGALKKCHKNYEETKLKTTKAVIKEILLDGGGYKIKRILELVDTNSILQAPETAPAPAQFE